MRKLFNLLRYIIAVPLIIGAIPVTIISILALLPFTLYVTVLDVVTPGKNAVYKNFRLWNILKSQ